MAAPPTIAVVNDDTIFIALMRDLLEEEGYTVTSFLASDTAYEELRHARPDLIVLDIRVGREANSWTVLDLLTLDPSTAHIPVILCSTDNRLLEAKANYFVEHGIAPLEKPFNIADLLNLVAQHLHGGSTTTAQRAE